MFKEKIKDFIKAGVLDAYHYADSAKGMRIQNELKARYGKKLKGLLENDKVMVYVCGAMGAKDSVNQVLAEIAGFKNNPEKAAALIAELEDKCLVQSTASTPDRFFIKWHDQQSTSGYLLPKDRQSWTEKVGGKSASNPESWAQVISSGESRAGGAGRI
jgi:hypothetical protein